MSFSADLGVACLRNLFRSINNMIRFPATEYWSCVNENLMNNIFHLGIGTFVAEVTGFPSPTLSTFDLSSCETPAKLCRWTEAIFCQLEHSFANLGKTKGFQTGLAAIKNHATVPYAEILTSHRFHRYTVNQSFCQKKINVCWKAISQFEQTTKKDPKVHWTRKT